MFKTPGSFSADDSAAARLMAVGRALLAFVVFPNLLFGLAGLFLSTSRALVNVDYTWLGAFWLWLPGWLRAAAFALLFFLDAVASTAAMYNVNPLAGVIALTRAPFGLLATVLLGTALAVGSAFYVARFAVHFLRDRRRRYLVLTAMLTVLVSSVATGLAESGALRLGRELRDRVRSVSPDALPVPAATDVLVADLDQDAVRAENILLVMIESMGVLRDPTLSNLVWAPMRTRAVTDRYEVRRGDVAFRGGTTSGEFRELCGVFADYLTFPAAVLPRCLPRRLQAVGFETVAVHGYKAAYYDRSRWYPLLFDSIYFEDRLAHLSGRHCGTQFRGVCDRDAFAVVARLVRQPGPRLVYWMTLDAHTPVDVARMGEFAAAWQANRLDRWDLCRTAREVCLQALFWQDLLTRLAALAAEPALPRTRFVLVGDHAPAFVRRERAWGYIPGRVPYLELIPRR